jgi:hypothetical protein
VPPDLSPAAPILEPVNANQRERIFQARRAAVVARLVSAGWSQSVADDAVAAWETHAAAEGRQRGAATFWEGADEWMVERRRRRR